jgi:hypothetical protein
LCPPFRANFCKSGAQIGLRKWLRYHLKNIMLLRDLQQVAGKARG